jgi:hypothetical protein
MDLFNDRIHESSMNQNADRGESGSRTKPTPPKSAQELKFLDQIPPRIWFPIGLVGFFFIVGGWNQLASTWQEDADSPVSGSAHSPGLLLGSIVFAACLFFGLRAWWRERAESRRRMKEALDWQADLRKHSDDIRFP